MEYDELNESVEESTEESVEESTEESVEESTEESVEESAEENIDYDRLEQIVSDNSYQASGYDTSLNDLPISDVLLLVLALVLGILCVKGRN